MNRFSRVIWALAFLGLAGRGSFAQPSQKGFVQVLIGTWAGDHIMLEVTEKGAQADLDCAHGAVDEMLVLDGAGRFDAKGSYTQESAGPQREGQPDHSKPARYAGRVQGVTMSLSITLTDSGQTVGTFSLTKDKTARITKCG